VAGSATSHSPSLPVDALAVVVFVVPQRRPVHCRRANDRYPRAGGSPLLFSFPDTPSCRCCSRATAERPETVKPDSTSAVASGWRRPVTGASAGASDSRSPSGRASPSSRCSPSRSPLLGLAYTLGVLAATLSGFAVLFMIVAVARRNQLPPDRRFHLPYDRWIGAVHRGVSAESSGVDVALNVALALVVLTSLAGWATRSPSRTTPNRSPRRRS